MQTAHHIPDPDTQPAFYRDVPTKRLMAWGVDAAIIAFCVMMIAVFTAGFALFFLPFLILSISGLYRTLTLANGSATWGMRVFAIELRKLNGEKFDVSAAASHTFGYFVSCAFVPLQLVSIALMGGSITGQGLTDRALGTVMLNKRGKI